MYVYMHNHLLTVPVILITCKVYIGTCYEMKMSSGLVWCEQDKQSFMHAKIGSIHLSSISMSVGLVSFNMFLSVSLSVYAQRLFWTKGHECNNCEFCFSKFNFAQCTFIFISNIYIVVVLIDFLLFTYRLI